MRPLPSLVTAVLILGCSGDVAGARGAVEMPDGGAIEARLGRVARQRVYFGHQSVGYNIVEGLEALAREHPGAGLRLVEGRSPAVLSTPAFAHAKNGRNQEPLSKIADFAESLEGGGLGDVVDVAFFKFCYVDFPPGADVEGIFAAYRETMARLRARFPRTRFVHVTSPLTVVQSGPKALIKRLLGRPLGGAEANAARERFNALLREAYAGREPVLDLAAVEATGPDGRRTTFNHQGRELPALVPEYASDGKHLNQAGARHVALALLRVLSDAVE